MTPPFLSHLCIFREQECEVRGKLSSLRNGAQGAGGKDQSGGEAHQAGAQGHRLLSHQTHKTSLESLNRKSEGDFAGASPFRKLLVCGFEHSGVDRLLLPHLHRPHLLPVMAHEGAQVPSHHRSLPLCHEILSRSRLQDCIHSAHR